MSIVRAPNPIVITIPIKKLSRFEKVFLYSTVRPTLDYIACLCFFRRDFAQQVTSKNINQSNF